MGERPSIFTLLGCIVILLGIVLNVIIENKENGQARQPETERMATK